MSRPSALRLTRRTLLAAAGGLAIPMALPSALPRASAQAATSGTTLKAAPGRRPELAGQRPLPLFNDALPGPAVRLKQGQPATLRLQNGLGEAVELAFPGLRLPLGATPLALAPGESREVTFTPPDAGTFLYQAQSPAQHTLAGALVIEEAKGTAYDTDHLLVIQAFPQPGGMPVFTVNGAVSPTFSAPAQARARLRLVNASPAFLPLKLHLASPYVLAIDGQPVEPFAAMGDRLQLPPGGRADIAAAPGADGRITLDSPGGEIPLATIAATGSGPAPSGAPIPLPSNGLPPDFPLTGAARFDLPLGEAARVPAVLGSLKAGRAVVLTLTNPTDAPVAVNIQGHPARPLDHNYDGWQPWWHDTVPVAPGATVRVAFLAQTPGRWPVVARRGGDGAVVVRTAYEVTR